MILLVELLPVRFSRYPPVQVTVVSSPRCFGCWRCVRLEYNLLVVVPVYSNLFSSSSGNMLPNHNKKVGVYFS